MVVKRSLCKSRKKRQKSAATARSGEYMMKRNISPSLGYANGSQGKIIVILSKEGNVLPGGAPGEMIMIEPREYIIMEVTHKEDK